MTPQEKKLRIDFKKLLMSLDVGLVDLSEEAEKRICNYWILVMRDGLDEQRKEFVGIIEKEKSEMLANDNTLKVHFDRDLLNEGSSIAWHKRVSLVEHIKNHVCDRLLSRIIENK